MYPLVSTSVDMNPVACQVDTAMTVIHDHT